jgi:hypothetical protein
MLQLLRATKVALYTWQRSKPQRDFTYSSVSLDSFHIATCDLYYSRILRLMSCLFRSDSIPTITKWTSVDRRPSCREIHTVPRISILSSNILNWSVRITGSTNLILYLNGWNAMRQLTPWNRVLLPPEANIWSADQETPHLWRETVVCKVFTRVRNKPETWAKWIHNYTPSTNLTVMLPSTPRSSKRSPLF